HDTGETGVAEPTVPGPTCLDPSTDHVQSAEQRSTMRRMRFRVAFLLALAGCSDQPTPTLSIDPSGTVQITQPTAFNAVIAKPNNKDDVEITWSVTGTGKLSNTTGFQVTFSPPTGTSMATLTATAGDLSAEVTIMSAPVTLDGSVIPGLTAPVTVEYD